MHITSYKSILMAPPKEFKSDQLLPILRKIYGRVNRRALEDRSYDYQLAPHLQKIVDDLANVGPHVAAATAKLLATFTGNRASRTSPQIVLPLIWALGKMKKFEGGEALLPFLHHYNEGVRFATLEALRETGYHPAVPEIMKHVDRGVPEHPMGFYEWSSEEVVEILKTLVRLGEAEARSIEPYRDRFANARYRINGFLQHEQLEQIVKLEKLLKIR
jgi:HEAT repeat protein